MKPDAALVALIARARSMTGPAAAPAQFDLVVRQNGSLADDGTGGTDGPDPDEELVAGAIQDVLTAVHEAHGNRWAVRGTQDQWHEGDHSEGSCANPVRLDSLARSLVRTLRRSAGDPDPSTAEPSDPSDLSSVGRTARAQLARAVVESMRSWTAGHLYHMFGAEVLLDRVLSALEHPAPQRPVNYFRRLEPDGNAFTPGRVVLAGTQLPLDPTRLHTLPTADAVLRTLYARTTRQYTVPPTAGERAEANARPVA